MNNETPINVDGSPDLMGKAGQLLHAMRERAGKAVCLLDARMRTLTVEPEEGAATAEYAVVLVAATGFAAVLVGIMRLLLALGILFSLFLYFQQHHYRLDIHSSRMRLLLLSS